MKISDTGNDSVPAITQIFRILQAGLWPDERVPEEPGHGAAIEETAQ
ncbi:hypothetical protein [Roseobacter ponti]|uniref:Uncharacterized protein n=1 Tax=Roseobacter ponti TaxID=1891787 RepID=A0A858STC1_9RHOB|nr:hypothetical protein [Roseobacter ponti]QJF51042.1 hypothetical protein G3256_07660 [Roseobacter ponti]